MWTRSAINKETGLMTVVCTDWNGEEFFRGEFTSLEDAEAAGQDAERRMTMAMSAPTEKTMTEAEIDDDALLAELLNDTMAARMFCDEQEARREIAIARFMASGTSA